LSHELIVDHFLPHFESRTLAELADAAVLGELALTTDSYVVTPRFFPGGDIGYLSVCGTVNDLAMVGAEPIGLTAAFVLEEGLPLKELDRIVASMATAAKQARVEIVAGDTKVVPRGACDGVFINTSGLGKLSPDFRPMPSKATAGDAVIVSGTLGDHGMAVMTSRQGLKLQGDIRSDVAPLNGLVRTLREAGIEIHALRDPTRGGVAQSLIEIATAARVRIVIEEQNLLSSSAVLCACALFGFDPLYVANEGKLLAIVPEAQAPAALRCLKGHRLGKQASIIGRVTDGDPRLELKTTLGAHRTVRMPQGELLPRIC
jgi:hydrogenase expression/formation protein HypE